MGLPCRIRADARSNHTPRFEPGRSRHGGLLTFWHAGRAGFRNTTLVRGLHLGSGSAMKLCSTRLGYLWLEAAGSGPQQTEGEPPNKEGVHPTRHDRFPDLERVLRFRFHHTAEEENERPEWSVRRWVSASFFRCHSVEVFRDEFGSPLGRRVVVWGC
jgi:hypothetical protein